MDVNDIKQALQELSQDQLKEVLAHGLGLVEKPEQGIGTILFEASLPIFPQPCVEALVVDDTFDPKKVYLTWREDQHYRGWHTPGTFIRLGETFEQALERVLQREIGTGLSSFRATNVPYSHPDSRGHTVGTTWLVESSGDPTGGEWHPINKLPEPTLFHHKDFISRILQEIRAGRIV